MRRHPASHAETFHGRYAEALQYVEQSERAFAQLPGKALDLARLALVKASALRMQNRSEEALELTRQAARTYRRYNDRPRYVNARITAALTRPQGYTWSAGRWPAGPPAARRYTVCSR